MDKVRPYIMRQKTGDIDVHRVFYDKKLGDIFRIDADREYFHFRKTPSGLLRVGPIVKQGEGESLINGG